MSGIVTAEDLALVRKRRADDEAADLKQQLLKQEKSLKNEASRKKGRLLLSFSNQDDDEDEDQAPFLKSRKAKSTKTKATEGTTVSNETTLSSSPPINEVSARSRSMLLKKDPTVDTDFLPDKDRAEQDAKLRAVLEDEWSREQQRLKNEVVEVVFSYWDGSGHRRTTRVSKGTSIGEFLEICRRSLLDGFLELRVLTSDSLLYVKEDLIIPHHLTFYDLIVTKARGKSGPLFHFGVRDDIRLNADARIETDESHAGKIVTRSWYERNKHIFPVTRWEIYDPSVKRNTTYTTHGV